MKRNKNIVRNKPQPRGSIIPKAMSFCRQVENEGHLGRQEQWVSDAEKIVHNGHNNAFSSFLLYLKENCGDHDSIIKGKANFIIGDGLKYENQTAPLDIMVNERESLYDFTYKCLKDYLIFNYFAVEVSYNHFGEPVHYYHIPAQKLATNMNKSRFEYRDNWSAGYAKPTFLDAFNPDEKSTTSKIFWFEGEMGSGIVYPVVDYSSIFVSALTDIAISKFNLNNIKNHFSVSSIITHYNGTNISDDIKEIIYDQYKELYTGETGDKFLVDFQNQEGKGINVQNIGANDWDKAYIEIAKNVSEKVQTGHSIVSPMLFGIKTAGQLGGASEMEQAYQIFQLSEGNHKRRELSNAFNFLFSNSKLIGGTLDFKVNKSLLSEEVTFDNKMQFMTINEIRISQGLQPIEGGNTISSQPKVETNEG